MDFETLLLKQLITSEQFFSKIIHLLKGKYFKNITNKKIFDLIKNYYDEYHKTPNLPEIIAQVKDVSNAELRNEIAKQLKEINGISASKDDEFMCNETVKFIKDSLYFEALLLGSEGLQKKNDDLKLKAQSLLDERAKITIDEDLGIEFDDVDKMIQYFSERNIGILTQHKELNKRLGTGFLPGTLSVICAAQGVGKSLLMCDLISGMIQKNKNVLLVSLEMSKEEMMKRIYANVFNINVNEFADLSKTEGELQTLERNIVTKDNIINAYQNYKMQGSNGRLFIKDYPTGTLTANMLNALVKKYKEQYNIKFDVIFVDYLGIAKSSKVNPNMGTYSYIKSIGEEFRAQAKELNCAIISGSQLQRAAINKVQDVDNSNIADSVGTLNIVDFCLFILQNEQMKEDSQVVMKVTKNRFNGRTDTFMMDVDYSKMRFNDCITENGSSFKNIEQKQNAENYANKTIKDIQKDAMQKMKDINKSEIEDIFKDLGV